MSEETRESLEMAADAAKERLLRKVDLLEQRKSEWTHLPKTLEKGAKPWAHRHVKALAFLGVGLFFAVAGVVTRAARRGKWRKRHPPESRAQVALTLWHDPELLLRRRRWSIFSHLAWDALIGAVDVAVLAAISRGARKGGSGEPLRRSQRASDHGGTAGAGRNLRRDLCRRDANPSEDRLPERLQ
jgi:hypothetical protein